MLTYSFADLITHSGASRSEIKNWVSKKIIRPDVRDTHAGTGDHRTFGFLDIFEGCIGHGLNQLPGGMPVVPLSLALDRVRFESALAGSPWRAFHDPETRDREARFWLCKLPNSIWQLLTAPDKGAALWLLAEARTTSGPAIILPLHQLLLDLETRTQDHASDEECVNAWSKEKPRSRERRDALTHSTLDQREGRA